MLSNEGENPKKNKVGLFSDGLYSESSTLEQESAPGVNTSLSGPELIEYFDPPVVSLKDHKFAESVLSVIPAGFAQQHCVIPLSIRQSRLSVAMTDLESQAIEVGMVSLKGDALHHVHDKEISLEEVYRI